MVLELVGAILVMLIKPFSVLKVFCMVVLRGTFVAINTWVEILSASIYFHVNIFWRFVLWSWSLITLPVRALVALQREKQVSVLAFLSHLVFFLSTPYSLPGFLILQQNRGFIGCQICLKCLNRLFYMT